MLHRFGDVEVDDGLGEVRRGGVAQSVEPQVFEVLRLLIRERHRVVHKEELLDEVWGSRHVSASAVTSRIKSARQAVGDSGRDQRMIRTVHGRGYRFVAELSGEAPPRGDRLPSTGRRSPPGDGSPATVVADQPRAVEERWPLVGRDAELAAMVGRVERGGGGTLISGPAGVGKTRLASAVLDAVALEGFPVARINGHNEATGVPLAAFAHLMPDEVVDVAGLQGDLARTALFRRAREAILERAAGGQLVLMVDDVDRIDRLSSAVVGSMIADGSIVAVMTQRLDADGVPVMADLVRSGRVEHLVLGTVADDQLTALLARVLEGPVDPSSAETLVSAARGSPGMLRQLVESCSARGSLARVKGFWTVVGRLTPPADLAAAIGARIADLDRAHREAVELIALAGDLDLDLAFDLLSDEVLDELELDGMITVRMVGSASRIRVAHPMFGEVVLDELPALRARRHRRLLADALSRQATIQPADRLQLVRLRLASGGDVDDEALLESAALAILEGDNATAMKLANRVRSDAHRARTMHLRGEALYLSGRFAEAGAVLTSIDLGELDDVTAAYVLRRVATWRFFGEWEHDRGLDELAAQFDRWEGEARHLLESYWTMIAGFDGRHADEALGVAARLAPDASGISAIEAMCGAAMAHVTRGEHRAALAQLAEFRRALVHVTPGITWSGPNFASLVEIIARLQIGDPASARAVIDRDYGVGAPPPFRFVAFGAGRVALASGEYRLAFDWLDPYLALGEQLGIQTNTAPMRSSTALAALALGDHERARREAAQLRAVLPAAPTMARFDLLSAILRIEGTLGDPDPALLELLDAADRARSLGSTFSEGELLASATYIGGGDKTADRLGEIAATVDGDLATIRHRAALAVAGRADLDEVLADLDARGLVHEAWSLRRLA